MNKKKLSAEQRRKNTLSGILAVICVIYVFPVLMVVVNSFKLNTFVKTDTFALPTGEMYAGLDNFIKGMTFGNYPFFKSVLYSVVITLMSAFLILLFTSMAAWYIARVNSLFCKVLYFLCVFSMVIPFQMVMYTLSKTADKLKLNTPWTIPIVYLGFGAGLAIFMFVGFVKSIPLEIEEAAAIDGCGPLRTYFSVVLPMLKPTMISVGILEIMWVWNDYLLPVLVLDINEYRTIPIHIQYLIGQLRHRGPGRHHGPDSAVHHPGDRVLPHLSEAYYCRRGRRRGEGVMLAFPLAMC
jgi:raffinose/stachyose/melibiose transport system permease protein